MKSANSCKYYLPCESSNVVGRIPLRNKLSVFDLNARSLVNKLTQLHILLESLDYSFDVIVITETWETIYTTDLPNIPNYTSLQYEERWQDGWRGSLIYKRLYRV